MEKALGTRLSEFLHESQGHEEAAMDRILVTRLLQWYPGMHVSQVSSLVSGLGHFIAGTIFALRDSKYG